MAKCDLCGSQCKVDEMQQLQFHLRVEGIEDLCPSCAKKVNSKYRELSVAVADNMKQWLTDTRAEDTT